MTELVGRTLGRYEIGSLLGAGGMGSVYRARDTEMKRDVAVKVLADADTGDPQRLERFNREIRTVARLDHPNILEIHDFGQAEGIAYAVMELLKGRDLRQLIRKRLLPLDQALEIAIAVAEGLGAAHHQGVLHRDIKPENIFVTSDGTVKILDFGLARHVSPSTPDADTISIESNLTTPGTVVGTTAYMSPEQVRGHDLDARSDIFSLGCVLYEMFSGAHPFYRDTRADTMSAILNEKPKPLSENRSGLPPAVELIIAQCLNKNPEDRFDSARDVAFALGALSQSQSGKQEEDGDTVPLPKSFFKAAAVVSVVVVVVLASIFGLKKSVPPDLPAEKHLAIVPFDPLEDDSDLVEYANGLSEILATDLSVFEQESGGSFWIVPPDDARYMGVSDVETMFRIFNVNLALTGTIETTGSRLGVTISLVEPRTGRRIAMERIEEDAANVSALQTLPALVVAQMLGFEIRPETRDRLASRVTNVTSSYSSFVRGLGLLTVEGDALALDEAVDLLHEATSLDPVFTPARESLARAHTLKFRESGERRWYDEGISEVREVIHLRSSESAYWVLGDLLTLGGRQDEAAAAFETAAQIAPRSGLAYFKLGRAYERLGRIEDAEDAYQRSMNLRPGYWPGPNRLARLHFRSGDYDAAAIAWREVTLSAPLYHDGYNYLGAAYSLQGRNTEAQAMFERSIALEPVDNFAGFSNLGTLYMDEARFADAIRMYLSALEVTEENYFVWGNLGYAYTFSTEPEKAREPFLRAIELAEDARRSDPQNPELLSMLAGYYSMIDEVETGLDLLGDAVALDPREPRTLAIIGETFEDLGHRDRALEWIERSLEAGISPERFENRPMLRELLADERYRRMVERFGDSAAPTTNVP